MATNISITAQVTLNLRLATKQDFVTVNNTYKIGAMYFLRSLKTGEFDNKPYYISQLTDKQELNNYKKMNQIYVPVGLFDDCIIKEK